jgi:hypothetical protein
MLAKAETPKYPLQLSSAFLGDFLSPSTVDVWLGIVTGLSSAVHMEEGFVVCSVERVSVQVSSSSIMASQSVGDLMMTQQPGDDNFFVHCPQHTLYISAHGPSAPDEAHFLQQSPLAILDRYAGHQNDGNAPEWVRQAQLSVIFQYQAAPFAKLFTRLATWKVNLDQVSCGPMS